MENKFQFGDLKTYIFCTKKNDVDHCKHCRLAGHAYGVFRKGKYPVDLLIESFKIDCMKEEGYARPEFRNKDCVVSFPRYRGTNLSFLARFIMIIVMFSSLTLVSSFELNNNVTNIST